MTGAPVPGAEGNRPLEAVQNIATRTGGGWESRDLTTANNTLGSWQFGNNAEYKMFTSDLSSSLVEPPGTTPLSESQKAGGEKPEQTLYLRESSSGALTPLLTDATVPAGTTLGLDNRAVKFIQASSDLHHVIIGSEYKLTSEPAQSEGLYEWKADEPGSELKPVSVLTNQEFTNGELGSVRVGGGEHGAADLGARHAVSDDGSLVVWGAVSDGHLYLRDVSEQRTIQLDTPRAGASGSGSELPEFQGATGQGFEEGASGPSRIYFTDSQQLTSDSHAQAEASDLYVAELHGSPVEATITDLTPGSVSESADVIPNILGYGENSSGAYVYYVAQGAFATGGLAGNCKLSGEEHTGTCNLYVEHYEDAGKSWLPPRYIATLADGDEADWGNGQGPTLEQQASRVSSNGQYLAFMSERELTGYDNHDAQSGQPDSEVYLFDAQTGGVRCVSCNPSGAQPQGVLEPVRESSVERPWADPTEIFHNKWLAANLSGWDTSRSEHAIYQPRYLSNSGRTYFNSVDGLVPGDKNSTEDVYEYEPAGASGGQCNSSTQSATELFLSSPEEVEGAEGGQALGCVGLISSGTSGYESGFLDATESGQDVFFATRAQLVPQDIDNAYDVYDAHVCSSASPCSSTSVSVSPPCSSAEACRGGAVDVGTTLSISASATLSGNGNILPAPPPPPKPLTRAEKLTKALKVCKKDKAKKKRTKCERTARSKYALTRKARRANQRSK